MKVLITGFDPFNGETINPAYEAVEQMTDSMDGNEIIKVEVPTVFGKSQEVLFRAIEKEGPDVVICVGQAGGRFAITPEFVAINLDEARIDDNEGNRPVAQTIEAKGENAYFSTLPVKAIVKTLVDNNIPAEVSYTAGTFVCNHLFYGLMHGIQTRFPKVRGGFIHVPYLPEQTIGKKNQPFMSLDMIVQGLELAVKATLENSEEIAYEVGIEH